MTKKNTAATIITIVIAVLALATTLFLLYRMSQEQTQEMPPAAFVPSDEVNVEMNENAVKLVKNNCEVFRVFLQYGLPHETEPYNNKPDDGLYTVKSDTYKSVADLEKLLKETFVEKEAQRILDGIGDNGKIFADQKDGTLGIAESCIDSTGKFKGLDYAYSWTNANVTLLPVSNTECKITIELAPDNGSGSVAIGSADSSAESSQVESSQAQTSQADSSDADSSATSSDTSAQAQGKSKTFTVNMLKVNGVWLLEKLAY